MKTKYIPQESADIMLAFMSKIRNEYPNVEFLVVADDEGTTEYKGNSPEEVIEAMDGIDSDFGLNCYDFDSEQYLGWFFLTPYEEDAPVCDHDDNDFCKWALDN